ncbi:hypothetical protein G6K88_14140 [Agrobacterium rhizogenes]|nr:hypothetical protein [Rhizobium rhizogenes]NTI03160.1 hypothetical protein [Rhizobium rhizogenes]NTI09964.1 hypothetical protein [Rhizobium rhizogenes]TRB21512.1 hypothetical protein EXN70_21635 [Rhizobium rhizogenes]
MARPPSKYFGLRSSTDLYLKLLHDIERLQAGGSTKKVQYAAFDAAVTGSHILDWVLNELTPEAYLRLTGLRKGATPKKGDPGPITSFIERNDGKMDRLDFCRQIANAVKHMKFSLGKPMKDMAIGSTVKLQWTDKRITNAYAIAYIQREPGGKKIDIVELFQDTAEQWRDFLEREGLWVEQPPDQEE